MFSTTCIFVDGKDFDIQFGSLFVKVTCKASASPFSPEQ